MTEGSLNLKTWLTKKSYETFPPFVRFDPLLDGQLRVPVQVQSVTALLVDTEKDDGVLATLTLELIPSGAGALYPTPAFAFVERDWMHRRAEQAACHYLKVQRLWPEEEHKRHDVRWRLELRAASSAEQPITALVGPSLGLAFTIGMAKLLVAE